MSENSVSFVTEEATSTAIRTPEVIAAEIRFIDGQARQYVLQSAIEIGKKLIEAKELVEHGQWGGWLEANVSYKQSTANNFMRIATEYDGSQAMANLSYSQAVALLSVPADEREAFAEEVQASELSTRELQAAIKAREQAEAETAEAVKRAQEAEEREQAAKSASKLVSDRLDEVQKEMREASDKQLELEKQLAEAQKAGDSKETAKLKTELRKAEKDKQKQEQAVADLKAQLETIKAAAEQEAAERLVQREQELKQQADEQAKEIQAKADQEQQELKEKLGKLEQQLQRSNNESFLRAKMQLQQLVSMGDALVKAIAEVKEEDEQAKLKTAAVTVVDQLRGKL